MRSSLIEPQDITQPSQLLAVSVTGLIELVGIFLGTPLS